MQREQPPSSSDKTFRELLKESINDPNTNVMLIGEAIHDNSPATEMIKANIDVLMTSPRKVMIVFEALNQRDNPILEEAEKKKKLKTKFGDFRESHLYAVLIANGIHIFGAENDKSNPFFNVSSNEKWLEKSQYANSLERTINANEVFAQVISTLLDTHPKGFVILIGGAGHMVRATLENQELDPGIKGRLKEKSIAVLLENVQDANKSQVIVNFPYTHSVKKFSGQYDYAVLTNEINLFRETFDTLDSAQKEKFLLSYIETLVSAYWKFGKASAPNTLRIAINNITTAFNQSEHKDFAFSHLSQRIEQLIEDKEQKEKSKLSSLFKKKKMTLEHVQETLRLDGLKLEGKLKSFEP